MREFEYLRPNTIAEAISLRQQYGSKAVILNGGTDIVIQLRERLIAPAYVIDIKHIPDLKEITFDEQNGLTIGCGVTMNAIGNDPIRPA